MDEKPPIDGRKTYEIPSMGADAAGAGVPLDKPSLAAIDTEDRKIDLAISNILRSGVIVSSLIVLAGMVLIYLQHADENPQYHFFHGEPQNLTSLAGVMRTALAGRSEGILQFGIVLLLLTPILRVGFSVLAFVKQRDHVYVVVALIVLSVLLFSLLSGNGPSGG